MESELTVADAEWKRDAEYPPAHWPFFFENEGGKVYGAIYVAQGKGPNPCIIMTPEVGGYDRLTSLFNPILMAGISVAWFFPRGMWDGRQTYTLDGALSDLKQTVAYMRSGEVAGRFRIDTNRIALGGMSGGGGALSMIAAAEDPDLHHVLAASPWNFAVQGKVDVHGRFAALREASDGRMDAAINDELQHRLNIVNRAAEFIDKTVMIVNGAHDVSNPVELGHKPIVEALRAAGVKNLTDVILDSDHLLLTKRRELEELVISWLREDCGF